jgi:Flp pilus assembly protein TadD
MVALVPAVTLQLRMRMSSYLSRISGAHTGRFAGGACPETQTVSRNLRGHLLLASLLVAAVLLAYVPALRGGYVWDDDLYLTRNPLITAPDGLFRIWFSLDTPSQYFPLVYTSFRFEHALWGFNPFGYHLVNVLLHAANAILIYGVLRMLGVAGAWFPAFLFALHPVQVESVAWITERKNVLSTLFFLLALLLWLRYLEKEPGRRWPTYGACLLLYAIGLSAKTTVSTLPAAMLLICWYRGERCWTRRLLETTPFMLLGGFMGALSIWWERNHQGTAGPEFAFSLGQRVVMAGRAVWFYLWKLVWPTKLAFSYPRWDLEAGGALRFIWPAGVVLVVGALWWWRRRLGRGPLCATLFFLACLAPLLGFISLYTFRYTFVADHYQYLACAGPLALLGAGPPGRWWKPGTRKATGMIVPVVILAVMGILTWSQGNNYRDAQMLWQDTIAKNPRSWLARGELGLILSAQGRLDDAFLQEAEALRLKPDSWEAQTNFGVVLERRGQLKEAYEHQVEALRLKPEAWEAHTNFGVLLERLGRLDEAMAHYREALRLWPDYALARSNLGAALVKAGRTQAGGAMIQEAIRNNPDLRAMAHLKRGDLLAARGMSAEAEAEYREALRIKPDFPAARTKLDGLAAGGSNR